MKHSSSIILAFLLLLLPVTAMSSAQHKPDVVIAYSADIRGNIECSG